jgi:hypothetical protein
MSIESACHWLQSLECATQIRESGWLFPTIETVHVFCVVLVVGSIMLVDVRLLGLGNVDRPFTEVAEEMLPWTWSAFIVAAIAGLLMFTSKAVAYYGDFPFLRKMVCLVLAGLNMAFFHRFGMRDVRAWDCCKPPLRARFAGGASLLLWITIIGAGRWIGFTT